MTGGADRTAAATAANGGRGELLELGGGKTGIRGTMIVRKVLDLAWVERSRITL
jgi:hypothetical protein